MAKEQSISMNVPYDMRITLDTLAGGAGTSRNAMIQFLLTNALWTLDVHRRQRYDESTLEDCSVCLSSRILWELDYTDEDEPVSRDQLIQHYLEHGVNALHAYILGNPGLRLIARSSESLLEKPIEESPEPEQEPVNPASEQEKTARQADTEEDVFKEETISVHISYDMKIRLDILADVIGTSRDPIVRYLLTQALWTLDTDRRNIYEKSVLEDCSVSLTPEVVFYLNGMVENMKIPRDSLIQHLLEQAINIKAVYSLRNPIEHAAASLLESPTRESSGSK